MSRLQFGIQARASMDGGFFNRPWVQKFFPFLTSLSFHAILLILGFLTYTAIRGIEPAKPLESQITPADSTFSPAIGLPQFQGSANLPNVPVQQDKIPNQSDGSSFNRGAKFEIGTQGGGTGDEAAQVFDAGQFSGFGQNGNLINGRGTGNGKDNGDGLLAPIGHPQIGGVPTIFVSRGASRIAYVCDASGSMLPKIEALRVELTNAVNGLNVVQSFSIIFFQDEKKPRLLSSELIRATPENKRKAGEFLQSTTAHGTTHPIPGLEAAFKQKPELIFLLTDGDFPDNQAVLKKIRELNKAGTVRVKTIAFVDNKDRDTAFIQTLKAIAAENGGSFKLAQAAE